MAIEPPENDLRCQPTGFGDPISFERQSPEGPGENFLKGEKLQHGPLFWDILAYQWVYL